MADPQLKVSVNSGGVEALRQRLQEVVDGNRIALNLRQQNVLTAAKAVKAARGQT